MITWVTADMTAVVAGMVVVRVRRVFMGWVGYVAAIIVTRVSVVVALTHATWFYVTRVVAMDMTVSRQSMMSAC